MSYEKVVYSFTFICVQKRERIRTEEALRTYVETITEDENRFLRTPSENGSNRVYSENSELF